MSLCNLSRRIREKTAFDKMPCYLCQELDPWIEGENEEAQKHPCDLRLRYFRTFDKLCKDYKNAGDGFWSAEKWRIKNKGGYVFMNHNLYRDSTSR